MADDARGTQRDLATRVRDAVVILAADAAEQERWLKQMDTFPAADELALNFEDEFVVSDRLAEHGLVPAAVMNNLRDLDARLAEMGDAESKWYAGELATDPDWAEVRGIARKALQLIDAGLPVS
jgi:hypothetical protein